MRTDGVDEERSDRKWALANLKGRKVDPVPACITVSERAGDRVRLPYLQISDDFVEIPKCGCLKVNTCC